ncbi:MAG: hypothetical protein IAE87_07070 [Rhodobacteraceae bacterium]|nr:hypothetical protein [Paracoccaceae bacterium]
MYLIVGTRRIVPTAIHPVAGGVEVALRGEALVSLLDATFRQAGQGAGSIEVSGGDMDRRPMDVAAIEMTGADARVTLLCAGPPRPLN